MLSATGKCHTCGNESWVDECAECWKARQDDQRRVMCGDRVLAGQWSGVVAAQHGPFSWVVIDGINVPQTWGTSALKPVENSDGE